jgi:hypothetical protein
MMISCAPRAAILWRPVLAAVDDGVCCHGMLPNIKRQRACAQSWSSSAGTSLDRAYVCRISSTPLRDPDPLPCAPLREFQAQ